ncbi:uncharacterized protein TRIREDRAFT_107285 [Trichoderma reesei QM6a]|uniref:Predicted protein n=1 Tax=Hypocrea jecorina (strain QM6a) TaxID=431241 RepID=G0RJ96_HYPJQ|nr:uncharacterized protein TRIREDRAFT_107285 [Trichoderma reesei QM6a]EGR48552.1 predicted protein [Trichoderma reesei QM6a]
MPFTALYLLIKLLRPNCYKCISNYLLYFYKNKLKYKILSILYKKFFFINYIYYIFIIITKEVKGGYIKIEVFN